MNCKTTIVVGLLVTVICAGCFTARHPEPNEPSYQGRPLSKWLEDFDVRNNQPKSQALAADAVRHIGLPAEPFLVERLSEARWKQFNLEVKKWRHKQERAVYSIAPPANPRHEALAGLDALGSAAADALPALGKLLDDDPPDPRALYVAARIGPVGVSLLTKSLTNEVKVVRLSARVCLDMMSSRSEVLYPKIPAGPDAPSFDRRNTEFNLKVLQAAFQEYKKEHPNFDSPSGQFDRPLPTTPSPQMPIPVQ